MLVSFQTLAQRWANVSLLDGYYDSEAAVNLNFNTCSMTRGNMYKLQKSASHYNLRKHSFCSRVVNIWNSLPNEVVEGDTINIFLESSR